MLKPLFLIEYKKFDGQKFFVHIQAKSQLKFLSGANPSVPTCMRFKFLTQDRSEFIQMHKIDALLMILLYYKIHVIKIYTNHES